MSELTPKSLLVLKAESNGVIVRIYGDNVRINTIAPRSTVFVGSVSAPLRLLRFCWDNNIPVEQYTS